MNFAPQFPQRISRVRLVSGEHENGRSDCGSDCESVSLRLATAPARTYRSTGLFLQDSASTCVRPPGARTPQGEPQHGASASQNSEREFTAELPPQRQMYPQQPVGLQQTRDRQPPSIDGLEPQLRHEAEHDRLTRLIVPADEHYRLATLESWLEHIVRARLVHSLEYAGADRPPRNLLSSGVVGPDCERAEIRGERICAINNHLVAQAGARVTYCRLCRRPGCRQHHDLAECSGFSETLSRRLCPDSRHGVSGLRLRRLRHTKDYLMAGTGPALAERAANIASSKNRDLHIRYSPRFCDC